jgi:hypothetical protein
MEYEDNEPITTPKVIVKHDDIPIGCIQKMSFIAESNKWLPEIEFVFPNFADPRFDLCDLIPDVTQYSKWLSAIPYVKVTYKDLEPLPVDKTADEWREICLVKELGTDGFIDSFPVKQT